MGQIVVPGVPPSLILSAVDRLVASNADGGLSPTASHLILLGEQAGSNNAASRVIFIGWQAGGGAGVGGVSTGLNGSIALGSKALSVLETEGTGGLVASNIAIGENAGLLMVSGSANILIGQNVFAALATNIARPVTRNVIIGDQAASDLLDYPFGQRADMVVIGYGTYITSNATSRDEAMGATVVIGSGAVSNYTITPGGVFHSNVFIGHLAGQNFAAGASGVQNVVIGESACDNEGGAGLVAVGAGTSAGGVGVSGCVAIGRNAVSMQTGTIAIGEGSSASSSANDSIAIGSAAVTASTQCVTIGSSSTCSGTGGIRLGFGAGTGDANTHRTIIETVISAVRRTIFYGDNATGNVILGNSVPGTDRDLDGTNTVKVLNGTAGAAAPVGGGRFYASGGELHWLSSANVDYLLTVSANRGTFAVAALPAANLVAGQRAYVNNALGPAFGAAPAGGGAVFVPVFYNGAAWIVG